MKVLSKMADETVGNTLQGFSMRPFNSYLQKVNKWLDDRAPSSPQTPKCKTYKNPFTLPKYINEKAFTQTKECNKSFMELLTAYKIMHKNTYMRLN